MGDASAARRATDARKDGFTRARILNGGIGAWKTAGFTMEGEQAALPSWAALFPQ